MISEFLSCTGSIEKFDTHVHGSATQERNLESSCIEEVGVKSIFPELGPKFDSSVQVNLTNSVLSKSPKFIRLGHPPMETADIPNLDYISATRPKNCKGLRRSGDRDDWLRYTHDFETMSETTA